VIVFVLIFIACTGKFTIPDKPMYERLTICQINGAYCMEEKDFEILKRNVTALKNYADKMREILEQLKKMEK